MNTSEDNDLMESKEAKMVIVEVENRDKSNSTKQEPASIKLIMC